MADESDFVRVHAVCRCPHRGGRGVDLRPVREGFVVDELLLRQVYVRSWVFTYQLSLCLCSIFLLLRPPLMTVSLKKPQIKKSANVHINVTMRSVPVTFVATEKR
jgi:hypothetical protein